MLAMQFVLDNRFFYCIEVKHFISFFGIISSFLGTYIEHVSQLCLSNQITLRPILHAVNISMLQKMSSKYWQVSSMCAYAHGLSVYYTSARFTTFLPFYGMIQVSACSIKKNIIAVYISLTKVNDKLLVSPECKVCVREKYKCAQFFPVSFHPHHYSL